ncbi:FAD binding domain-containing protein, partial [Asanoa sp. NPDC050611]|uniref:FAD binding domain-containing protein n=1 Tax=Asanoa sp. NPDC050611 TaxID=3157098 RepID=UPI0033CCE2D1
MLTEVHVPDDVSAAVRLLDNGATVLGGGTSLMPRLNDYASPPTELVSLRRTGLAGIRVDGGTAVIGAATTLAQVEDDERLEVLNPVVRSIASVPVRNLATVGGNLFAHQPHGDLAVALVALAARLTLADGDVTRELPVADFVDGDRPRGLVTEVAFALPAPGSFRYLKAARRRFNSASIVTVAAVVDADAATAADAGAGAGGGPGGAAAGGRGTVRIALGGVGDRIVRAHAIEAALAGRPLRFAVFSPDVPPIFWKSLVAASLSLKVIIFLA